MCTAVYIVCETCPADLNAIDYPCYELYTDVLRHGIFGNEKDKQLRLVVGKDRKVKAVQRI